MRKVYHDYILPTRGAARYLCPIRESLRAPHDGIDASVCVTHVLAAYESTSLDDNSQ